MPRSSLLAGAAALTVAAANLPVQNPPNFSGRWVEVDATSSATEYVTIGQTDRTVTLSPEPDFTLTFLIEGSDASSVRIKGPYSMNGANFGFAVDTTGDGKPRMMVRAQWSDGKIELHTNVTKLQLNSATMRLTLDRAGNLLIETEISAIDDQPAKRTSQRFRRV